MNKGRKKHINFFNINFLPPTQNAPLRAPRKKFICASFPGKERKKRDPHKLFPGDSFVTPKWDFGVAMLPVGALCFYQARFGRTVLPKWPFWAHLLLCILQCFGASEGMLPPGACRSSRASARRIVSCRGLCASSLCSQIRGRILYTPTPPPLKIPFKGWGAYKKGGGIKFLLRGGAQNIHPHPPPLKNTFWPEMGGGGGGVYNFSPDQIPHAPAPAKLFMFIGFFAPRTWGFLNFQVGADFGAGDPTKHFSVKKKGFSVKRGEGFSERGVW